VTNKSKALALTPVKPPITLRRSSKVTALCLREMCT
jgi:hypothetical protein